MNDELREEVVRLQEECRQERARLEQIRGIIGGRGGSMGNIMGNMGVGAL